MGWCFANVLARSNLVINFDYKKAFDTSQKGINDSNNSRLGSSNKRAPGGLVVFVLDNRH